MAVQIRSHNDGSIITVEPGDTISVTVDSQAIVGHIVRGATDFANALGCEVVVETSTLAPAPEAHEPEPSEPKPTAWSEPYRAKDY